jgi:hypothetical protein
MVSPDLTCWSRGHIGLGVSGIVLFVTVVAAFPIWLGGNLMVPEALPAALRSPWLVAIQDRFRDGLRSWEVALLLRRLVLAAISAAVSGVASYRVTAWLQWAAAAAFFLAHVALAPCSLPGDNLVLIVGSAMHVTVASLFLATAYVGRAAADRCMYAAIGVTAVLALALFFLLVACGAFSVDDPELPDAVDRGRWRMGSFRASRLGAVLGPAVADAAASAKQATAAGFKRVPLHQRRDYATDSDSDSDDNDGDGDGGDMMIRERKVTRRIREINRVVAEAEPAEHFSVSLLPEPSMVAAFPWRQDSSVEETEMTPTRPQRPLKHQRAVNFSPVVYRTPEYPNPWDEDEGEEVAVRVDGEEGKKKEEPVAPRTSSGDASPTPVPALNSASSPSPVRRGRSLSESSAKSPASVSTMMSSRSSARLTQLAPQPYVGHPVVFRVDRAEEPPLVAAVKPDNPLGGDQELVATVDLGQGVHEASFVPSEPGVYTICVFVRGHHIQGSPFRAAFEVKVEEDQQVAPTPSTPTPAPSTPTPAPSTPTRLALSVGGSGLVPGAVFAAGSQVSLFIEGMLPEDMYSLAGAVAQPDGGQLAVQARESVSLGGVGRVDITFTPTLSGAHRVILAHPSLPTPFEHHVTVTGGAPSPAHTAIAAPRLALAEPALIKIQVRDAFGNRTVCDGPVLALGGSHFQVSTDPEDRSSLSAVVRPAALGHTELALLDSSGQVLAQKSVHVDLSEAMGHLLGHRSPLSLSRGGSQSPSSPTRLPSLPKL